MAQFRTTADIKALAMLKAGELTGGTSPYDTQALNYLNRVHFALLAGGTIPIGKDWTVEIDEVFPWARSRYPIILELQPKYNTGSVSFTQGSQVGTFSAAPTISLEGYHIRVPGLDEVYKIASHSANSTSFNLESVYSETGGGGLQFEAFQIDYELIPSYIVVNATNDQFQFQKATGVTLTSTLTHGSYTPSALISHVAAQATTAAGGPTITGSYSTTTRKFSLTSDLAGATSFYIVGDGNQSLFSIHKILGYDDITSTTSAATQVGIYIFGGIARLVEPFRMTKGAANGIFGCDSESFHRNWSFRDIVEGFPDRFTDLKETEDGRITVRINRFPREKTKIEINWVPVPHDLKDNAASIPIVPRKHLDVLEDATVFYLMTDKSDDRAPMYAQLIQGKLTAMISQYRGQLLRSARNFGRIQPRPDLVIRGRRRLLYGDRN